MGKNYHFASQLMADKRSNDEGSSHLHDNQYTSKETSHLVLSFIQAALISQGLPKW